MGEHLLSLLWRLIKAKTQRQAVPTDRDAQLKAVCTFRRLEDRVTFAPTTWAPPQTSTSTADFIFPSEYSSRTITNCGPPSTSLVWATRLRSIQQEVQSGNQKSGFEQPPERPYSPLPVSSCNGEHIRYKSCTNNVCNTFLNILYYCLLLTTDPLGH